MAFVQNLSQSLRRLLSSRVEELDSAQRRLRYAIDLTRHCARQLNHDRATQMAAALTYRTIFSLIPLFVLVLLIFRAFGGFDTMGQQLQVKLYNYLGLSTIRLTTAEPGTAPAPTPDPQATEAPGGSVPSPKAAKELEANIETIMADLTERVAGLNFASIGTVALPILIWGALALVITVEQSFNQIFNSSTGRPWHLRIAIYWAIVTLGPVLFLISVYVSDTALDWLMRAGTGMEMMHTPIWQKSLEAGTALLASWTLLFLVYVLMPNTKVAKRPALIGSLVAAILWELGKGGFKLYVRHAVGFSAFYGSLGLIPLFLFWVYLTWLIVLFGLELTYTLQTLRGRQLQEDEARREQQVLGDPQWLIPIMALIGRAFQEGKVAGSQDIADQLRLPARSVVEFGQRLAQAGLIHRVTPAGQGDTGYTLARPPAQIRIADLLELGRSITIHHEADAAHPGWSMIHRLTEAQVRAAGDSSLDSMLKPG